MTDDEMRELLERNFYTQIRKLPDGCWVGIDATMLYLSALCVGLDENGYLRRYDYPDRERAIVEIEKMEIGTDVPTGWIRRLPEPCFFTISGLKGHQLSIGKCMQEREIITAAQFERWDNGGDWPDGDWPDRATLSDALQELNGSDRVFEIYQVPNGSMDFLSRVNALGLDDAEAGLLIEGTKEGRW